MRPPQQTHGVGCFVVLGGRVRRDVAGLGRRDAQQCAGLGDVFDAASIGQQTVVANAVKAVGQNMQQEAADEFVGVQAHGAIADAALWR